MRQKLKVIGMIAALAAVLFVIQYKILDKDTWGSWNLPLSGKVIYIDPGHGGPDGGAGDKNALEKDIALDVSIMIRDYLQEQGALVIMTREEDVDLADEDTKGYSRRKVEDLHERLKRINDSEADLYLSVHLNSIPSAQWSGAQTFYNPKFKENEAFAKAIQKELIRNLENTTREAKGLQNVYILKHAKKPGALVEIGFLSNPGERANLLKKDYQEKIAASVYEGIMDYLAEAPDKKE
ncbi:N-acetylmuramoyl-L-alanine amidase CwlD [Rossellomorea marisflavi]|jgi:N-acetylmuramoyl-L-alanine amidase|uniref:N-acetylmuramoyl-L-alanine amidase CwlD n=1 Tax=Rossellomorea marisflavi TaxID=189381 RepID=UPI0012F10FE0|nr:N-acetylmuramoyl-L-alanine amidase CwlD [Rossellomorea marisflavi]MCM2591608.1 N-acetylmuramoyl-L-alanine amidase CwlD [Rossellomorea marisflavi]MDR4939080.1 N-acetylmuramoyl-L-alanine amidase CwlD [Rossellomorea marisflavi]UTE72804.1 N-acetylmuramoyl-L-alanine amidase CwlD [Rossellomorea marisflavi]VXA96343.1 N-acetylmuramoyl-L-alanine amidase [Bacillus sp. 349Y]